MTTNGQLPRLVMIIRHAEKPGNPDNDKDGGPNLSILGSARAAALPSLFTPDPAQSSATLPQLTCDKLTEALGVRACQLPWKKWPGKVFDLVFSITWPSGQAQLSISTQQLLYGDSATAPALGKC